MPNYTMFISGLKSGTKAADTNSRLAALPDSEIVMIFDSVDNYSISLQNEKTQHPIESRSNITDHVFSPDGKFSFVGRVTTAPYYVNRDVEWDKNTDPNAPKSSDRISKAYDVLKAARDSRSAISLEFEEGSIINYVITDLDMSREGPLDQMVFSVTLTEMRKVTVGRTVLAMNVGAGIDAKSNKNLGNKSNKVDDFNRRAEIAKPAINPNTPQFKFFEQNLKK
ncbi:phage baseplate protein [Aeromonas veronii]